MSMTPARRAITTIVGVLLLTSTAAGCIYERHPAWASLTVGQQQAVRLHESAVAAGGTRTCLGAMRVVWPRHLWPWATSIMRRESGLQPGAANRSSSARGCWQLLMSLHSRRFRAVGCSPQAWSNALCNNRAAYHLYRQAGRSPWRL